jgi:hypothetical protein
MSTELYDNGILKLQQYYSSEQACKFLEDLESVIERHDVYNTPADPNANFNELRRSGKFVINKRLGKRDGDEGMIDLWNYNLEMSEQTSKMLTELNDHVLTELHNSFPGVNYELKTHNAYINNSIKTTRGIHADSHFFPSRIKSFLYLTEIPDESYGPFSYIKKSHFKEGLKYHRKYDIYEPLTPEDKSNYTIYTGINPGDVVIAAVSGAHRGLPQAPGKVRMAIVSSYDPVKK